MLFLSVAGVILVLGLLGLRNSQRSYLLMAAVAVILSYFAYTR